MAKLIYSLDKFQHIKYDELSFSCLINTKTNQEIGAKHYINKNKPKCIKICVDKKYYMAHRIIWLLKYGTIDQNKVIDHIDGNPFNNKIDNLRLVSHRTNSRNCNKTKQNNTGKYGIIKHRTYTGDKKKFNDYIVVSWKTKDGKSRNKHFNIKKFPSEKLAIEFAELYREIVLLNDDSYTNRHGYKEIKCI